MLYMMSRLPWSGIGVVIDRASHVMGEETNENTIFTSDHSLLLSSSPSVNLPSWVSTWFWLLSDYARVKATFAEVAREKYPTTHPHSFRPSFE